MVWGGGSDGINTVPQRWHNPLSLAHSFGASPNNGSQGFQGVAVALFTHGRGEGAAQDPSPRLAVTIHLGWGHPRRAPLTHCSVLCAQPGELAVPWQN